MDFTPIPVLFFCCDTLCSYYGFAARAFEMRSSKLFFRFFKAYVDFIDILCYNEFVAKF